MLSTPWVIWINVGSAIGIWLVVWYLASHLSAMVRQRDAELAETNRCLRETQLERTRHMLRTTHELKAPFAAIHANAQLLLKGYCGPLSAEATEALERTSARARRLANEIQEMLQLANLRSGSAKLLPRLELDVAEVLRWARNQIQPLADERDVTFQEALQDGRTRAVEDHLKMLFVNVLTNAVVYSQRGGQVGLSCLPSPDGPVVVIEDHGIGIPADKLPHIFEEYYRTTEAVKHNQQSSGLGLAIVQQVAEDHRIRIRVSSRAAVGTRFELTLPAAAAAESGRPSGGL
jgi:signal transduction histidine kinase